MALATMLLLAAPVDLKDLPKKRLRTVKKTAEAVEALRSARTRGSPAALQSPRSQVANALSALYELLQAFARVPADVDPIGRAAQQLVTTLFPGGLRFTRFDAVQTWAHARRLLRRIADEGLEASLLTMGAAPILEAMRASVTALGHAIGVGSDLAPTAGSPALIEAVSEFQNAVAAYARSLAAEVDPSDEASVARFFAAVAPIDELRDAQGPNQDADE
jgi:hypothetical protein